MSNGIFVYPNVPLVQVGYPGIILLYQHLSSISYHCTFWYRWDTRGLFHRTTNRGWIPSVHPVPLYHLVQVGHPGIIPLYQPEALNPKCPSCTIVPTGTSRTSWDNPIIPTRGAQSQVSIPYYCTNWYSRTSWDNPNIPTRGAQSQVSIPYHCTNWYR